MPTDFIALLGVLILAFPMACLLLSSPTFLLVGLEIPEVSQLMREVNHRSKNLLAVVQAVARQTAAKSPKDFVSSFEQRLLALAKAQDLLIRGEWRHVVLEDLVRAELSHFAALIGRRIILNGPDVAVTPAAAQALGMAFHELATNAAKYGALSNDVGAITVTGLRTKSAANAGKRSF